MIHDARTAQRRVETQYRFNALFGAMVDEKKQDELRERLADAVACAEEWFDVESVMQKLEAELLKKREGGRV